MGYEREFTPEWSLRVWHTLSAQKLKAESGSVVGAGFLCTGDVSTLKLEGTR